MQIAETGGTCGMKACVLYDVGHLEVREIAAPAISANDVLLQVAAVGICGTDTHIFAGHANYNVDASGHKIPLAIQPQILGHEICGRIVEIGANARGLRAGQVVVVDQGLNCWSHQKKEFCAYCRSGDSHQCDYYGEHGITGLPGALAEFIAVPWRNVVPLGSDLPPTEAALTEPLGCIIHASEMVGRASSRYRLQEPSLVNAVRTVLACGAGPAGLLFIQYLRSVLRYEHLLLVSEPNQTKAQLAKQFGADHVIDPASGNLVEAVQEFTSGRGIQYLIEASGHGRVFSEIPSLISKQATVLLYGHGHAGTDLSVLNSVMFKEPCLIAPVGASGGFESDGRPVTYARALDLIERRTIEVAPLITHRFAKLTDVQSALTEGIHDTDYVKGVVLPNGGGA
jgi:threonine dehydrogenase-like Zn-dependent dehydrogenase